AACSHTPRAPVPRPPLPVPGRTSHHIVAIAQGDNPAAIRPAHRIPTITANETVRGRDGTAEPRAAVAPGRRSAIAVPVRTCDHVVAVAQGGNGSRHTAT